MQGALLGSAAIRVRRTPHVDPMTGCVGANRAVGQSVHEVSRSDPVALVDLRRLRRPGQPSAVHIRSSGRSPAALVIFFIVLLLGWAFIWRRSA